MVVSLRLHMNDKVQEYLGFFSYEKVFNSIYLGQKKSVLGVTLKSPQAQGQQSVQQPSV